MDTREIDILTRLDRLEKRNRNLTFLCGILCLFPILAVVGWQTSKDAPQVADNLRVRKLEVVDSRGVPLVTLGAARLSEGGMITLRDNLGEKRTWWQAGPRTAELTLSSVDARGENDNTAGFVVGPDLSKLLLIGKSGALLSGEMRGDDPRIELISDSGKNLFTAPWK